MQRGTRFAIFDIPFGAPCWAQRGRQKYGKTNIFVACFHNEEHAGSGHQKNPEEHNLQNMSGK